MKLPISSVIFGVAMLALVQPAAGQRFATNGPYQRPAGASPTADLLRDVGIDQRLNVQLPLDAEFRNEANQPVRLGDVLGRKPVILALVYYRCPMLCTQVLNGIFKTTQAMPLQVGQDFDVIVVSIDPRETADMAAEKKRAYLRGSRRESEAGGWHFLTGDQAAIDQLASTVGYRYRFDPITNQFAHASGIVVVTPDGRTSRYFYGIEYDPRDLRLALVESGSGKIGSLADQVLLLCYHYDPLTGKYGLVISRVLWGSGLLTVVLLSAFLRVMWRMERRRPKLRRPVIATEAP